MQYGIYTPNFGAEISARALAARLILTVGQDIRPMLILLSSVKTRMRKYALQSSAKD